MGLAGLVDLAGLVGLFGLVGLVGLVCLVCLFGLFGLFFLACGLYLLLLSGLLFLNNKPLYSFRQNIFGSVNYVFVIFWCLSVDFRPWRGLGGPGGQTQSVPPLRGHPFGCNHSSILNNLMHAVDMHQFPTIFEYR